MITINRSQTLRRLLGLFSIVLIIGACKKEADPIVDNGGVIIKLPHHWVTSLSDDKALVYAAVSTPIRYAGENVLVGARKNQLRSIMSINALTGFKNWEWQDALSITADPTYRDPFDIGRNRYFLSTKYLFFPYNTSSYFIDLTTGQTQSKYKTNLARFDITGGIGDQFFSAGGTYLKDDNESLYMGRMASGQPERLLFTPVYTSVVNPLPNGFGRILCIVPFESKGDTLLSILYTDPNAEAKVRATTVSALYNLTKRMWSYERTIMNPDKDTWGAGNPVMQGQKVFYTSGLGIHCYDVMTGKTLWSFPATQGFSSIVLADGRLFTNCGDRYTYCLDPDTGQQIWKEESSGTSSPITYLNGILYFLGGGDGKLHAIDAATGRHLWRLRSPDEDQNSGAFFYGVCVAVPGQSGQKGQIISTTGLNAYGYEAIH